MRIGLLVVFLFFAVLPASAQEKSRTDDSESNVMYPVSPTSAQELNLAKLAKSVHQTHYRFSTVGQMVEIWTDDSVNYQGFVLNYIYRRKGGHQHTVLSKKEEISSDKAKRIVSLYDSLSLNQIPTEGKIRNWQKGLDGNVDIIEFADPRSYSIKYYWEPSEQKQVPGICIKQFFYELNNLFQLRRKYIEFRNTLPIGSYYIGMNMVTITAKLKAKGGSNLF